MKIETGSFICLSEFTCGFNGLHKSITNLENWVILWGGFCAASGFPKAQYECILNFFRFDIILLQL